MPACALHASSGWLLWIKVAAALHFTSSAIACCLLQLPHAVCHCSSLETARLMASALGGGLDSAEAGVAGVMAAMPPQYVEFKEQVRLAFAALFC